MKIRMGFVSNSSSASFVVKKAALTPKQLKWIRNAEVYGKRMDAEFAADAGDWGVQEDEKAIWGCTFMNNFDFAEFLLFIGVAAKDIDYDESNCSTIQEKEKWMIEVGRLVKKKGAK